MSLPVFQATIVNDSGDIIPSAVITVLDEITGLGLTVYSNRAGTVPLGTNGVFTAGVDGFAQFFAPAGNYRVKAEQAASGFEKTWDFVPLVGGSAFDVDSYTAFGIGTNTAPFITDANALRIGGKYRVGSDWTGSVFPGTAQGNQGTLEHNAVIAEYATQVFKDMNYLALTWTRQLNNGTWSAWQPVYTGANYQPDTYNGIGVQKRMLNLSGGTINAGATAPAGGVQSVRTDSAGNATGAGAAAGTWVNVSGFNLGNNTIGDFWREA